MTDEYTGPYKPPWYPIKDHWHNPWAVRDSMTGKTNYQAWCDSLPKGALTKLIEAHRAA